MGSIDFNDVFHPLNQSQFLWVEWLLLLYLVDLVLRVVLEQGDYVLLVLSLGHSLVVHSLLVLVGKHLTLTELFKLVLLVLFLVLFLLLKVGLPLDLVVVVLGLDVFPVDLLVSSLHGAFQQGVLDNIPIRVDI